MEICAIEGENILITSQKIKQRHKTPVAKKTLLGENILVFPVSVEIHGDGKIKKENDCKNSEGKVTARFCQSALLSEGSTIQGFKLYGFSKKPMRIQTGGPARTGGHTGQFGELRDFCFLCIFHSYDGKMLTPHPNTLFLA